MNEKRHMSVRHENTIAQKLRLLHGTCKARGTRGT